MATAAVQQAQSIPISSPQILETSSQPSQPKPRNIQTTLNYYEPKEDGSPPNPVYVEKPETFNQPTTAHAVTIHDVTGREQDFTLDGTGFQFVKHVAKEKEFVDDEKIKNEYYPEVEELLKKVTGASRVFIFDHTIRRAIPSTTTSPRQPPNLRAPVQRVHIDQSYAASLSRVPYHLPDLADKLLQSRVQIINTWRPIKPVLRDPLTVADAHSVHDTELIPSALIYPTRNGETLNVKYSPEHRWYYKDRLQPAEVLLIKCFDSKKDGRARRVPHTAFVDPEAEGVMEARESIEVRALVFSEGESLE